MQKRSRNQLVVDGTREPRMQQLPSSGQVPFIAFVSSIPRGRFGSSWTEDKSAFLLREHSSALSSIQIDSTETKASCITTQFA